MKSKFRTILLNNQKIILQEEFDKRIFENISYSWSNFPTHHEVATTLKDKNPYTITVLIENLKSAYFNSKEYVQKTRTPIESKYRVLLYDYFFAQYGREEGNKFYGQWLDKYRPQHEKERKYEFVDEYIIKNEFEPRYMAQILKRFKNHEQLFKKRIKIERDRYYNLPEPLNRVDWRNPYDNIFIWEENGKKVASRGGSGSSGGRERNSTFIYGLLELNKIKPVPSYLFIYSEENTLLFVTKFNSLCAPHSDIGANYRIAPEEDGELKQNGLFLDWNSSGIVLSITATSFDQSIKNSSKRFKEEFQKNYL